MHLTTSANYDKMVDAKQLNIDVSKNTNTAYLGKKARPVVTMFNCLATETPQRAFCLPLDRQAARVRQHPNGSNHSQPYTEVNQWLTT